MYGVITGRATSADVESYLALDVDLLEGTRLGMLKELAGLARQEDNAFVTFV